MTSSSLSVCCHLLSGELGSIVYFPETPVYSDTRHSYWSTQEALLNPSCVVRPESAADVSKFMSTVNKITNCSFAVKAQGHAPATGFANIDGGVTLDLSWLNSTSIIDDHSIASVETGSAWVDVYRKLNPFNKTVAGGRNGAVGVGGLTLGGGISYYSPQVGFTCDTVVNFEANNSLFTLLHYFDLTDELQVVLASSKIVHANMTNNADLYRALKGGGNNLGIVTRIDFKTVDTVPLRAGHLFQSVDYAEEILTAFVNIASSVNYDVHASIVTSFSFNVTNKAWTVVSVPIYTLPITNPPVYEELFAIPNITDRSTVSIENISSLAAEPPYPQKFQSFYTSTYAASAELLISLLDVANETLYFAESASDVGYAVNFEPLPTVFTQHGSEHNVLGTSPSDGNGVIVLLSVSWTDPSSTESAHKVGRALLETMDNVAAKSRGLHNFKYINYADPSQDPLASYGEDNVELLRQASAKYDPYGVFQRGLSGGFKLHGR